MCLKCGTGNTITTVHRLQVTGHKLQVTGHRWPVSVACGKDIPVIQIAGQLWPVHSSITGHISPFLTTLLCCLKASFSISDPSVSIFSISLKHHFCDIVLLLKLNLCFFFYFLLTICIQGFQALIKNCHDATETLNLNYKEEKSFP